MAKRNRAAVDSTTVGPWTNGDFSIVPANGSYCDLHAERSNEAVTYIREDEADGAVCVTLCADCLATGLERAMGVKMVGLMGSWRAMKAIKAEMNERRTAAKVDEKLNGSNTDVS